MLTNSLCLSADVNAALDPIYPEVMEKRNCAQLNQGVVLTKYTGSRGKSDTNDASAELMGQIRRIMDDSEVVWQIGELGKVDAGRRRHCGQVYRRFGCGHGGHGRAGAEHARPLRGSLQNRRIYGPPSVLRLIKPSIKKKRPRSAAASFFALIPKAPGFCG